MKILSFLLLSATCSVGQIVFSTDFDGTIPESINAGTAGLAGVQGFAGLGPDGNKFGGSFLRSATANTVKLQLTGLPPHTGVNLGFLLAAIDSLDGAGNFPSGDYFRIKLDDVTIFRESLANAVVSQIQTYVPAPGAELARWQDLGFTGPGSFYRDSAYHFGLEPRLQNIPHSSSDLKLEIVIEGVGAQDINDESWAIDNLAVTVTNAAVPPQPRLIHTKVTFPVGNTPYFTGILHGATPETTATLQASTDLGFNDTWQDLGSVPVNVNGSASFTELPDPSAAGAPRNFYRVKLAGP